jgi:hypothetical protein
MCIEMYRIDIETKLKTFFMKSVNKNSLIFLWTAVRLQKGYSPATHRGGPGFDPGISPCGICGGQSGI